MEPEKLEGRMGIHEEIEQILINLNSTDEQIRKQAQESISILEKSKEYYISLVMNIVCREKPMQIRTLSALMLKMYVYRQCDDKQFLRSFDYVIPQEDYEFADTGIASDIYLLYFAEDTPTISFILMQIYVRIITKKYKGTDFAPLVYTIINVMCGTTEMNQVTKGLKLIYELVKHTKGNFYSAVYIQLLLLATEFIKYFRDDDVTRETIRIYLSLTELVIRKFNKYVINENRFNEDSPASLCMLNLVISLKISLSGIDDIIERIDLLNIKFHLFYSILIQCPYFIDNDIESWAELIVSYLQRFADIYVSYRFDGKSTNILGSLNYTVKLVLFCVLRILQWGKPIPFISDSMDSFIESTYVLSILSNISDFDINMDDMFDVMYSNPKNDDIFRICRLFIVLDSKNLHYGYPCYHNFSMTDLTTDLLTDFADDQYCNVFDNVESNIYSVLDEPDYKIRDILRAIYILIIDLDKYTLYDTVKKLDDFVKDNILSKINESLKIFLYEAIYFHFKIAIYGLNPDECTSVDSDISLNIGTLFDKLSNSTENQISEYPNLYAQMLFTFIHICNVTGNYSEHHEKIYYIIDLWSKQSHEQCLLAIICIQLLNDIQPEKFDKLIQFILVKLDYYEVTEFHILHIQNSLNHMLKMDSYGSRKYLDQIMSITYALLWKYYQNIEICTKCVDILETTFSFPDLTQNEILTLNSSIYRELSKHYDVKYSSVFNTLIDLCVKLVSKKIIVSQYIADYFYLMMKILQFDDTCFLEKIGHFMSLLLWNYTFDARNIYDGNGDSIVTNSIRIVGRIVDDLLEDESDYSNEINVLHTLLESIIVNVPGMVKNEDMLSIILNLSKLQLIGNYSEMKHATICFIQLFKTDLNFMVQYISTIPDVNGNPMIIPIVKNICNIAPTMNDKYIKISGVKVLADLLVCSLTDQHPVLRKFRTGESYKTLKGETNIEMPLNERITGVLMTEYLKIQHESTKTENDSQSNTLDLFKNFSYLLDYYGKWIEFKKKNESNELKSNSSISESDYKEWLVDFVQSKKTTPPFIKFFMM